MKLSLDKTSIMIPFLVAGFLVHNFALQLFFNFKFHHIALLFGLLFFVKNLHSKKLTLSIYHFIIYLFIFFFIILTCISIPFSAFGILSLKYTIYLYLTILFSLLYIAYSKEMIINFNFTAKVFILIFTISLIAYIYLISTSEISLMRTPYLQSNRKELVNSINAFVFPEYGGLFLRFNGYNLDPNFWGLFCIVSFWNIVIFHEIAKNKFKIKINKSYYFIVRVIILTSLLLTFSRGSILAFSISYLAFVILSLNIKKFLVFILLLLSISTLLTLLYYNIDLFKEMIDIKIISSDSGSDNPRLEKWSFYLDSIVSGDLLRYMFGYGIIDLFTWHNGTTMHNTFIQLLISYGVLLSIILINYFIISLYLIIRRYKIKLSPSQLPLLIGTILCIFFIDVLMTPAFWIGILLPVYSTHIIEDNNETKNI